MLVKCKTKGSRVKGVVFHPRLHFLLASLHTGDIQMWDYLNGTLVEVFKEHDGPVRGIDFHVEQPLFVTGGDDRCVIVWDFTLRRKLFKLEGHLDYVRTVQFHTKYPWVMSASDDQNIRIWNWQSRSCITVISGHNHYVMSSLFHPTENMIISASLDHTARIWDISYLVEKKCSLKPPAQPNTYVLETGNSVSNSDLDLGVVSDVICLHTLTGHSSGVNYAIFFGSNLAITAGDDCSIRIWRYTEFSFYQTNILREHEDNVTCLLLIKEYLLSTSEDNSIRIWDLNTYTLVHTYLMDEDRFWAISKSRHSNYITAGHDSGLIVFKLYKERPLFTLNQTGDKNIFYYAWNNHLYLNNLENECNSFYKELLQYANKTNSGSNKYKDLDLNTLYYKWLETNSSNNLVSGPENHDNKLVFNCPSGTYVSQRRVIASLTEEKKNNVPFKLLLNPYVKDRIVLMVLYSHGKGSFMELFSYYRGNLEYSFKRTCTSAAFVSNVHMVAVDKTIMVYNFRGDVVSELSLTPKQVDGSAQQMNQHPNKPVGHSSGKEKETNGLKVYNVDVNRLLFFNTKLQTLYLFNTVTKEVLNQLTSPFGNLSDVVVNTYGFICCVFNNYVVIYDGNMNRMTYKQQFTRIKSAIWHNNTSVIYTTYNQVHYLLINGGFGVLSTMVSPMYLIKIVDAVDNKHVLYLINRQHRCFKHLLDSPDYSLKYSLLVNDLDTANTLINSGQLASRFTCSYLIKDRRYELARKLLTDNVTKFYLSIQFGHLQHALSDAKEINNKALWNYLGDVSMELGNVTIAELAYQKSKQYNKLTLLYLTIGDFGKLRKMLNTCKIHNNKSLLLLHALYLGDMEELSNVLSENGHEHLARICNDTYMINDYDKSHQPDENSKYMMPPKPINKLEGDMLNWNVSYVESKEMKFNIDDILESMNVEQQVEQPEERIPEHVEQFLERHLSDLVLGGNQDFRVVKLQLQDYEVVEGGGFKLILMKEDMADLFGEILEDSGDFHEMEFKEVAQEQEEPEDIWEALDPAQSASNEQRLFELLKKRDFTSSLNFLNQLYGEVNVEVLKDVFQHVDFTRYSSLQQVNTNPLNEKVNRMLTHFQNAELEACINLLNFLMRELFLYKTLDLNVMRVVEMCYWYALAVKLEFERNVHTDSDPKRSLELAAYLTCCRLEPGHMYLVLRKIIGVMWKAKNYSTGASMVTRLLKLDTSQFNVEEVEMEKAKKIHALCLQKGTNQYDLDFAEDDFANLQICTVSLTKLHNEPTVTCVFCRSYAFRKYLGQFCKVCRLLKLV
ncbi:coatomer complex subunit alpha [Theileria orientalis]|uniref:Coatomer complex subunit alpha n=1 Tax=Theileria orientalis TaxID=68886 RepID=A0A976MDD4_THEOR|nr:coatomer complex subunit alpha [Theileria orientalis]